jgi:hypothetical protein
MSVQSAAVAVNPSFTPAWSTTATPDWLFDEVAPDLDKAPLKVLLYIVRRTCGFRKLADAISLTQFQHGIVTRDGRQLDKGCGVTNRTNLLHALADLEARGLIEHQDAIHADGGNATTIYYLRGPGQGGGATSAPPPICQDTRGGVPPAHPRGVPPAHPQQTDVPTNRKIERLVPPTPTDGEIGSARFRENKSVNDAGDPRRNDADELVPDVAGAPAVPPQAQRRIDADYQALVAPMTAVVERLDDGAPPWASVSRGYGLMARAGLDVPTFLALLDEAELLMRPSLPHIEKPMAYLFRVVESLMQQGAPPQPRSTARPRSSDASPRRPFPAPQEPADAWGQVRAEIAREVTPENYARWFLPTQQIDEAGDVLTVAITGAETPAFHQQWLDRRLRGLIERCAARVRPGLHLAFVVEACAIPSGPVDGAR